MERRRYDCVFWSKDESDTDLTDMAQRGAHVPGVTDAASTRQRKNHSAQLQLSSLHNKHKLNMEHANKKKGLALKSSSIKSENQSKKGAQSVQREAPSLKDLRPEDKKRVANLIKELAKTGEEKEVAKEQLEVERRENEIKTKQLQHQVEAILNERENIQQQYLECQKLLSSYQSKVSEEQKNLSGSLHDGSLSHKAQNNGWSPIKESSRSVSPTSDRPPSKAGQQFMELQSVPVHPNRTSSLPTGGDGAHGPRRTPVNHPGVPPRQRQTPYNHHGEGQFIELQSVPVGSNRTSSHPNGEAVMVPPGPRQTPVNHHGVSEGQFNPVLSSTHRQHHRSRVPSTGPKDIRTARNEMKVNGFPSAQAHGLEQSHYLSKAHGSQREGSNGVSQETFLPMTEVPDDSRINQSHPAVNRGGREKMKSSDRNSWVSLPEMDGQFPGSYELHKKEFEQNDTSLPTVVSDAKFSRQRQPFEEVGSFQHDLSHQTRTQPDQGHMRDNRISTPKHDFEFQEQRQDYHSLTPEQRQRQLGSLKKKLQQEQGWLQQKLLEQEQLLHHKQLEMERQKRQLSQLDETGYEQVRRRYLVNGRTGEQYTERTGVGDVYGTYRSKDFQENGYHYERMVPKIGKEVSPWQQHVSSKYPPDDLGERQPEEKTDDHFGDHKQRFRYNEDNYPEYNGREVEDEETWYEMREETEGDTGSIQGYASFHPKQGTTKQGATNPGTYNIYKSDHTSDLRDKRHGPDARLETGYPSRIHEPQRQYGNITSLLEEEGLTGLSLNGSNPPYTRTRPRPDTTTNPRRRDNTRPRQAIHSNSLHQPGMHLTGQVPTRKRDRVTMDVYTPQPERRLNGYPATGHGRMNSNAAKKPIGGLSHLYTEAARDDVLHSHLVQRSHKVIQEIGELLNQSAEIGEEEESKVLEDVFFLK